jgi:hypothetical protein
MSCPADKERIAALCYGPCPAGYKVDGVFCNATQEILSPPFGFTLRQKSSITP